MNKLISVRIISALLSIATIFTFFGCSGEEKKDNEKNSNDLNAKAILILDELGKDQRIDDFRSAYDILTALSNSNDKFISQLKQANKIFEKYDAEFTAGDYYLTPNVNLAKENIEKYISQGAFHDISNLLDTLIYPILFEKYGKDAQSISGITADKVISAINSTTDYAIDKKEDRYDTTKEVWKYVGIPKSKYEIEYHPNGLVKRISVPIVRSDIPMSDDEYIDFFAKDLKTQKQLAGERFVGMCEQFSYIFTGYEVLSQIFTDEELTVISNYIHSLTLDDIWSRSLMAITGDPTNYAGAIVVFDYKGNNILINYGLNDITLEVVASNIINPLSHRWYTLWCGLCLPESSSNQEIIDGYSDYINNNVASNGIVQDYSFDLDANADKFSE